ncbi:hypothetical protein HYFRA_00004240 [Hymenoscyphus fraxineus]|uniref:FAD-binding domain-containing protein n=1 Tax=Hymenoscyphus fraxineus TaxID=746836 RepID=A0A9N9PNE2_9HELO|nr:hypothetical protein HYFRA_00004240 [Hymenoscyphus fraxineus]
MENTSKPTPFISGKKVIVSGAGIGGLAFAIAIQKHHELHYPTLPAPIVRIYERDSESSAKNREGYSMSIRSDGVSRGMQMLQNLGIMEDIIGAGVQGMEKIHLKLWDRQWEEIINAKIDSADLPQPLVRVARRVLKKQLLEVTPKETVIGWGVTCVGATKLESGKTRVEFSDGTGEECDLLIAADGSKSKLRAFLRPANTVQFAGAFQIIGTAHFPDGKIPHPISRAFGLYLNGSGNGSFVSPIDETHVVWTVSHLSKESREPRKDPDTLMKEVIERSQTFKEPFFTLLKATDLTTIRELVVEDKQPFGHDSQLVKRGVVFIGDANHAVSPFAGNGANLAMMDAWDLAEQLSTKETLEDALKAYDTVSMPRARTVIKQSHMTIALAHSTGWKLMLFSWVLKLWNRFRGW